MINQKFSDLTNAKKQKVYDLMAPIYGYQEVIQDGVDKDGVQQTKNNPETKAQFYERVKDENRVTEYLSIRSQKKAEQAKDSDIETGV